MSTISVSSAVSGGNSHSSGGGDSAAGSMTSSQISISTAADVYSSCGNPRVRFADSLDNEAVGDYGDDRYGKQYSGGGGGPYYSSSGHNTSSNYYHSVGQRSASSPGTTTSAANTAAATYSSEQSQAPSTSSAKGGDNNTSNSGTTTDQSQYQPQETVRYSPMYLCPQESAFMALSRSMANSPAGSNVSIIGSLVSPRKSASGKNTTVATTTGWKLRTRYSKRRGQERSIDRERQPSVCSDSETDSISGGMVGKVEEMHLGNAQAKKWSLPLPMVTRSSESDSASSSWSARSADEATEDERSPVPSPSASTHSGDNIDPYNIDRHGHHHHLHSHSLYTPEASPKSSAKAAEMQSRKLAMKAKQTEEYVQSSTVQQLVFGSAFAAAAAASSGSDKDHHGLMACSAAGLGGGGSAKDREGDGGADGAEGGGGGGTSSKGGSSSASAAAARKKKKMSRAAMSHSFQRMKTTNYGRCHMCDTYVYFWGCECNQCQLICHKKCLKKLTIMCPHAPLGPKCSILNKDIESLPEDEMVPILVRKCTEEIERRSLKRPGIYRMSGVATRVEKLLKSFESGPHLIDLIDVSTNDITSVLKIFLRELKEPLVPNSIYKLYIDVGRVFRHEGTLKDDAYVLTGDAEHSELIRQMRLCVSKLTPHRLATMRHMFGHLNRIAAYSSQNHMTPAAIGIIFAPTLFRPREHLNDLFTEVFEAAPQSRVIELLIRYYEPVFEWRPDYSDLADNQDGGREGDGETEDEEETAEDAGHLHHHHHHCCRPCSGGSSCGGGGVSGGDHLPPSPPLSPNQGGHHASTTGGSAGASVGCNSSDSNLFSNSMNMTANIGSTMGGGFHHHQKCSAVRASAAARHNQVRRTSSSSSASPSPGTSGGSGSGGTGGGGGSGHPCTANHHHHHHHHHHKKGSGAPCASTTAAASAGASSSAHPLVAGASASANHHHHCPLTSSTSTFTFE